MLVKFQSPAAADIIMFGAVAKELLHIMGFSGRIPSAVQAEDLPAVRERLVNGLAGAPGVAAANNDDDKDDPDRDHVPLATRAQPLLQMIEAAIGKDTYVMWDQTR